MRTRLGALGWAGVVLVVGVSALAGAAAAQSGGGGGGPVLLFGSKVAPSDPDAGLGLAPLPAGPSFCRVNLGDQALVTDDGYYFLWRNASAGASIMNNDLRIASVLGKVAGSLVTDSDTVEKVGCVGNVSSAIGFGLAGGATNVFALDFDQFAGYTSGDCVYLDRDASGTFSRWDNRLSVCAVGNTTYTVGTLAELGDVDLVNEPGAAAFGADVRFGFRDAQPNGFVDMFDNVYIAGTTGPGNVTGAGDVRLIAGTLGTTPTPTPTPTPPPTPTPTPQPVTAFIEPPPPAECVGGSALVRVHGHGFSASGLPVFFRWFADGVPLAWPYDANVTAFFPLGNTTVGLVVYDGFGNSSGALSLVRVVDSYGPSTSARTHGVPGYAGWWRSQVEVDLNAWDLCGIRDTFFHLGNGSVDQGDRVTLGDGRHQVGFFSVDLAGHAESPHNLYVQVDATPPRTTANLTGTPGANGWWRSAVQVALNASDAMSGVADIVHAVDGGPFLPGADLTVHGDGEHTVRFYAIDVAGNAEAERSLVVRIDATPPSARIADPARGRAYVFDYGLPAQGLPVTVVVGDKTVRGKADDGASGLQRVELWVDGSLVAVDRAPRPFDSPVALRWMTNHTTPGDHVLQFRAWDLAGNEGASARVNVTLVPSFPAGLLRTSAQCTDVLGQDLCDLLSAAPEACEAACVPPRPREALPVVRP